MCRTVLYMAKRSLPKLIYLDSESSNSLGKNANDYLVLLIHCCKTTLITESDASTATPVYASVSLCASKVALAVSSLTVENASFVMSFKLVDFGFLRSQ